MSGDSFMTPSFSELYHLLGSQIKALEVLSVIEGVKPAARMLCHEDKIDGTIAALRQLDLKEAQLGYKVLKDTSEGSYVERSFRVPLSHPKKGHAILYISKKESLAKKAREQESKGDHLGLGLLLGYPECCCAFFAKNFSEGKTDLTLDSLKNSDGFEFPFEMNIAARHFDASLLSHFPCSFGCEDSLALAKKNMDILEKHDPQVAQEFMKALKSAVLYTEREGAYIFQNYKKNMQEVEFSAIRATVLGKLYYALSGQKKFKIEDKWSIAVGGERISGEGRGVMVFRTE